MKDRFLATAALCFAGVLSFSLVGQEPAPAAPQKAGAKAYMPPMTPWGEPDLQGNWPAQFNIPQQRPDDVQGEALSEDELALREAQAEQAFENRLTGTREGGAVGIGPQANWGEIALPHAQTSLVIDPVDGKRPPLTPSGRDVLASERGGRGPGQHFPDRVDTPEDFDYYSRCISRGFPSTMLYTLYNYGNEIVQSPGYVVIRSEMVHEHRVIPTDGRAHVGSDIKTYMGNSVGHWEGNTLVVETTNLVPQSASGGRYTDSAKVIERFTRTGPDQLLWEATIVDPNVWTAPYTLRYPFEADPDYTLYEYACHEGNYMMLESLSAARDKEAKGIDTRVTKY